MAQPIGGLAYVPDAVGIGVLSLSGNTTGVLTALSSGTIYLAGGNNITLSQNGQSITISGGAGGGFSVGVSTGGNTSGSTGVTGSQIVLAGGNNITLSQSTGVNGATINISGANAAGAQTGISGVVISNTTYTSGTVSFSNANGLSFGSSAGQAITGSYTVPSQVSLFALGNTTQNSSTVLPFNALSLNGLGEVTAGFSNGSIQISAPPSSIGVSNIGNTIGNTGVYSGQAIFVGGNNITLSVSSAVGGAQSITISGAAAQTGVSAVVVSNTTYSSGTVTLQNANNISFGSSGANGISASFALNVSAAGGTSNGLSGLTFSNTNGVSFGLSTGAGVGTLSAAVATTAAYYFIGNTTAQSSSSTAQDQTLSIQATGLISAGWSNSSLVFSASLPQKSFFNALTGDVTTLTQIGNGSIQVYPINTPPPFSASRADMMAFNSISSSSNSSHAGVISIYAGLYTLNGSTLSLASSGSQSYQWTNTSNNSMGSISGQRRLSLPLNVNYTGGGDLWMAVMSQTSSTNANWFTASNLAIQPQLTGQLFGLIGQASNNTYQIQPGNGIFSTTSAGMPVSMALSAISGAGSAALGANVYMAPVQFANVTA